MLQDITAWPQHYNGPWYDTVAIMSEGPHEWYAQLRLLFSITVDEQQHQLALVRWFDVSAAAGTRVPAHALQAGTQVLGMVGRRGRGRGVARAALAAGRGGGRGAAAPPDDLPSPDSGGGRGRGRGTGRGVTGAAIRGGGTGVAAPVRAPRIDQLVAAGCTRLSWAVQLSAALWSPQWLQVVALESIVRRVHIVPDFTSQKKEGEYQRLYVSAFKYDRQPADKNGLAKE